MNALIIVPGYHFPYNEIEAALDWAKEYEASIKVLFITMENMPSDEYPFPNDLDLTDTPFVKDEPLRDKQQLLTDELRFLQRRASASHIELTGRILVNPSLEDVLEACQGTDKIFMDRDPNSQDYTLEGLRFDKKDLVSRLDLSGMAVHQ